MDKVLFFLLVCSAALVLAWLLRWDAVRQFREQVIKEVEARKSEFLTQWELDILDRKDEQDQRDADLNTRESVLKEREAAQEERERSLKRLETAILKAVKELRPPPPS